MNDDGWYNEKLWKTLAYLKNLLSERQLWGSAVGHFRKELNHRFPGVEWNRPSLQIRFEAFNFSVQLKGKLLRSLCEELWRIFSGNIARCGLNTAEIEHLIRAAVSYSKQVMEDNYRPGLPNFIALSQWLLKESDSRCEEGEKGARSFISTDSALEFHDASRSHWPTYDSAAQVPLNTGSPPEQTPREKRQ